MSSLIASVAEKAISAADAKIADPKWVENGVAALRRSSGVAGALAPAASAGLDYLGAHASEASAVAAGTFLDLTHHLALGRDEAAEDTYLAWLESQATPEERTQARLDAARGVVGEEDDSRASWAEFRSLVLGFIKVAGPAAVSILLQMLAAA